MTNKDLEMVAGSSWLMGISIKQENRIPITLNGSSSFLITIGNLDLTNATNIEFCVKKTSLHAAPKMLFKSLNNGINKINGGATGEIQVHLEPIDTAKLVPETYEYDLWVVMNSSRIPVLKGKLQIVGAVNTDV